MGKHLVIVESPAKAKTINRYLGDDYVVAASVGHVRDLPPRSPKGKKQPVPGVDLENNFKPSYEVLSKKKSVITELKKLAKQTDDVWFATDLDREGEAIAWHLAEVLGVDPTKAKRVVFNAITKSEIQRAFEEPHELNMARVNAQQARRILDRIVGYQVSPLLWKKVAVGLSAGRVQSVAVRIVVEREREIDVFVPDEKWRVIGRFAMDDAARLKLTSAWDKFMAESESQVQPMTQQVRWLAENGALHGELVSLDNSKFELGCTAEKPKDLSQKIEQVSEAIGLTNIVIDRTENPGGKGPAAHLTKLTGDVADGVAYRVSDIDQRRTKSKPSPPFITSTLQMTAANTLGYGPDRTMRLAQALYEGINVRGEGQVGLITYMRTDSTHISKEAIDQTRGYIRAKFGETYLPDKPTFYKQKADHAQEAHEAIRPTDVARHPDDLPASVDQDLRSLYKLIWSRFVGCQMTAAQWDATSIMLERTDKSTGAIFKATGRVLAFDGFYKAVGVPNSSADPTLPALKIDQPVMPFSMQPDQQFSSPPPRYSEASLIKKLETEGIGRPSTYASIIRVIQDRRYVDKVNKRFFATDLGEVVTDKLIDAFPRLLDVSYTRTMEEWLDEIAEERMAWTTMLQEFYDRFSIKLAEAHETMVHAKAETQPAPYQCPECGSQTHYRFGKNGRFLSCAAYPDCKYAAPTDREGLPLLPERVDIACPEDGSPMMLRTGRFGKFLASMNYPDIKFVLNLDRKGNLKLPSPPPMDTDLVCDKCSSSLYLRSGKRGPWLGCSTFPKCKGRGAWAKLEPEVQERLSKALDAHEKAHPPPIVTTLDGVPLGEATPLEEVLMASEVQQLAIHPDAPKQSEAV